MSCVIRPGKLEDDLLPVVTLQEKHIEKENIVPGAVTTAQ